jgi:hypothetical protein
MKEQLMTKLRIEKAIEMRTNFKKHFGVELNEEFRKRLNDWVKDNKYSSGNFYCENIAIVSSLFIIIS